MIFPSPRLFSSRLLTAPAVAFICLGTLACDPASTTDGAEDATPAADAGAHGQTLVEAAPATPPTAHPPAPHRVKPGKSAPPFSPMPDAKDAFQQVVEIVGEKYMDPELSEDFIWTAAAQGVMAQLVQLGEHRINTLLTPRELEELKVGVEGRLTGIGIMIENVGGVLVIRDLLPGGPATKSDLKPGDRILGVDGDRVSGNDLPHAVGKIRGPDGSKVDLFVQRDTEEWTETVTRGRIEVSSVKGEVLEGGVGRIEIRSLGKNTVAELDRVLEELTEQGAQRLVLDLRHCPGGLFEASVGVASRFLPNGSTVVSVIDRDGEQTDHKTEGDGTHRETPLVVLIGAKTASGAEIIAAALGEGGRATVVGERTLGKGTVEAIHELDNGWAVKLSISRFTGPNGVSHQGVGLRPDVEVRSPSEENSANGVDPQLDAARHLLGVPH